MTKEEKKEQKKPGVAKAGKPSEAERSEDLDKDKEDEKYIQLVRPTIAEG